MNNEFYKYATKHRGINSLALEKYTSTVINYISPTIIEERQLNVAQMDVFSRLMMDRIIFLGDEINDYVANIIQAQLLFLESSDPKRDIQIYVNSPGGSVYAGLGIYSQFQCRSIITHYGRNRFLTIPHNITRYLSLITCNINSFRHD